MPDAPRDIASETSKFRTGTGKAMSSHKALMYHLISPHFIRRIAERKTGGGIKYGTVQWRQGLNDIEYVADRLNHFWEHLMLFMESGNRNDDNIGAMGWALEAISEAERLCPDVLNQVIGTCNLWGESATVYHEAEEKRRSAAREAAIQ